MKDFDNVGVYLQLAAMLVLLIKIVCTQDCTGLSGRSQLLLTLAFSMRFLDIPYDYGKFMLDFALKIVFLVIAYLTIFALFVFCRRTYQREYDTFRIDYLGGTCLLAALITSYQNLDVIPILWHLSFYLETGAILPQIYFTHKAQYAGSSLTFYVGMLASYRIFHVVHWAYIYYWHGSFLKDPPVVVANGFVQMIVYCGYFRWMLPLFKVENYGHYSNGGDDATSTTDATTKIGYGDEKIYVVTSSDCVKNSAVC